jgi:phosphoglucomutase
MSVILELRTHPFGGQRPGTSGLRKKTRVFLEPGYLENFVQSVLDVVAEEEGEHSGGTFVVGGDGRYYNRQAIQIILAVVAGNRAGRVLVARDGILSTPAMSAVIRRRGARGGLVLSASHNPGGLEADFGIKYNARNGGPAPERLTEKIYRRTLEIEHYRMVEHEGVDLAREGRCMIAETEVVVFDPLADYTALMEEIFDFDALRALFRGGFRMLFDAMHGVTGPYARSILEERLGAPEGTVARGTPLEDFGGHHPDPNLVHAAGLVERMARPDAPDLGAACDGDGDRNMILGRGFYVSPGDSLAVIAEHARGAMPGYRRGLAGIARSMPTSTAADRVARALGIACHETPTGWKYFGSLMDAGLCTVCGEESFGTGSDHLREKDGLWAVLAWLSIIGAAGKSVEDVVRDHWRRFGRSYFERHDYERLDASAAAKMIDGLRAGVGSLPGSALAGSRVKLADDFSYTDPVDGSMTSGQGLRILLDDGSRIVCRLSGTGTEGATLRMYVERYRNDGGSGDVKEVLAPLAAAGRELLRIRECCGRDLPDVVT